MYLETSLASFPNHLVTPSQPFLAHEIKPLTNLRNFLSCLYNSYKAAPTAIAPVIIAMKGLAFKKLNASLNPFPVAMAAVLMNDNPLTTPL